jgi:Nuclease-related domain
MSLLMQSTSSSKRLHLRRADRCRSCGWELAVGEEAVWERSSRTVICLACSDGDAAVDGHAAVAADDVAAGDPGASALREHARRRQSREQRARERFGGLGVLITRLKAEPQSTRVWRQGGDGEVLVAALLAKHLNRHPVLLLHDRRVPHHGRANIDHLAVSPGGITVIDTKTHHGKIRLERAGGLFTPRRSVLRIKGRDQTGLIEGIERQIEYVQVALARFGEDGIDVRGALCFPDVDGLPLFGQLKVRGVVIDGPKRVAKLARRPGQLDLDAIECLWRQLADSFPKA